jgi:hypothetical protein
MNSHSLLCGRRSTDRHGRCAVQGRQAGSNCRCICKPSSGDGQSARAEYHRELELPEKRNTESAMTARRNISTALPVRALALGAQDVGAAQNTNSPTTGFSFPVGSGTLSNAPGFSGGNLQVEKAEVLQHFVRRFDSAPRLQLRNLVDITFECASL